MNSLRTRDVVLEITALLWRETSAFVKLRIGYALLLLIAVTVISSLAPVALKLVVDALAPQAADSARAIPLLILLYVLSQWAVRVLAEVRAFVDAQADRRMYRVLTEKIFAHIMDLPLRFHLERRTGAVSETLTNGLNGYQMVVQQSVYTIFPVILELVTVAVVLVSLDQSVFMLLFFAALIAYAAAFSYGTSRVVKNARDASGAQIDERAVMTDAILNYETVKYFTAESIVRRNLDGALSRTESQWMQFFKTRTLTGLMISTIFAAFLAITTLYAARQVMSGAMTVGDFVLVNAYMFQLARPVESLGFAIEGLSQGIAFLERIVDLLRQSPEPRSGASAAGADAGGALEFRKVSVGYRRERPVLRDISFVLHKGGSLGIVGASGAGKSTLVRLLVRLLEPDEGEILLDGVPSGAWSLERLRRAIAVVPQDTVLFNDTIGYNIGFGKPGSTQAEIESAARVARMHEFILTLPDRYDTNVGERGLKLSGGEKQRISIARAALKQPKIFVFDEATSSLDSATEAEIMSNLRELSQFSTTLIIAHRLSTVAHVDQIVVIDHGAVAERGTHGELLRADGKYAALWRAQQRGAIQRKAPRVRH